AIDNKNFADPTPGTIRLEKPGNLAPETNNAACVVPENGTLPLTIANGVNFGGSDPEDPTVNKFEITELPKNGQLYANATDAANQTNPITVLTTQYTLADLQNLVFVANDPNTFTGDTFKYKSIDSGNKPDPTPATVTLKPSPRSSDGFETIFDDENTPLNLPVGTPSGNTTIEKYRIETLPATGILYIGDPSLGNTVTAGDELTPTELAALYFDPPINYGGGSFTYTPIDSNGTDAPTAKFRLNVPPNTDSAQGIVNPGETIDLDNNTNNTGTATMSNLVVAGADPNQVGGSGEDDAVGGTVVPAGVDPLTDGGDRIVFYEFDLVTLPTNGTLFVNGVAINGSNILSGGTATRILASDIDKLSFTAATGFESAAIEYRAIDTYGAADRTPAQILLKPTNGNFPPDTNDVSGLIDVTGKLPLTAASLPKLGSTDPDDPDGTPADDGADRIYKLTELPLEGILY
ncbi:MAG: hypothetical protein EAZ61_14785, partial [Oscillatoriales cyanobacterium]